MKEHMIEELLECLNEMKSAAEKVPVPPESLGKAEMNVLHTIHVLKRELSMVKITDISKRLNLQSPNVIALVKKLEQKGLVVKTADKKDKRVVHVVLTEEGHQLVEKYVLNYQQMLEHVFKGEEEELKLLIKHLRKIGKKIDRTKSVFIEELGGEDYE